MHRLSIILQIKTILRVTFSTKCYETVHPFFVAMGPTSQREVEFGREGCFNGLQQPAQTEQRKAYTSPSASAAFTHVDQFPNNRMDETQSELATDTACFSGGLLCGPVY